MIARRIGIVAVSAAVDSVAVSAPTMFARHLAVFAAPLARAARVLGWCGALGWIGLGLAQPTLDALAVAQLPSWSRPVFESADFRARLVPDLSVNPFVQSGDFDGDGFLDVAVLVRSAETGERGIALLLQDESAPRVLAAGGEAAAAGTDWSWLVVWHVERRLPAGANLAPRGDILVLAGFGGAHLWLFHDEGGWRWVVP